MNDFINNEKTSNALLAEWNSLYEDSSNFYDELQNEDDSGNRWREWSDSWGDHGWADTPSWGDSF